MKKKKVFGCSLLAFHVHLFVFHRIRLLIHTHHLENSKKKEKLFFFLVPLAASAAAAD